MRTCAAFALAAMSPFLIFAVSVAAQDTNFASGPQYLATQGSPLFARPIATPSLSLETQMEEPTEHEATAEPPVEPEPSLLPTQAVPAPRVNFFTFYYAPPLGDNFRQAVPAPELTPAAEHHSPENSFDSGVSEMLDARALRRRGYGVSLAEEAAQWKSRKPMSPRTYTNEDIARLPQGN